MSGFKCWGHAGYELGGVGLDDSGVWGALRRGRFPWSGGRQGKGGHLASQRQHF